LEEHEFIGGAIAVIEKDQCEACGICSQICRFEAVLSPAAEDGTAYRIDPIDCEGCAACVYQCPSEAISMHDRVVGRWFRSASRFGPLFHAELYPAQENSGKLVTLIKQQARSLGLDTEAQLLIIDGPPGIGCPVISASAGADLALIVAEPTAAGIHDMERVLQLANHFRLPSMVCINKADIYPKGTDKIEGYCKQNGVEIVGSIPFDESVTRAMIQGEPVNAYQADAPASLALKQIWQTIAKHLIELERVK